MGAVGMRYVRYAALWALVMLLARRLLLLAYHSMPSLHTPPTAHHIASVYTAVLTSELYVAGHARPHPELCRLMGAHTRLVILVTSAPAHAVKRKVVRLTWGQAAKRADVAVGFIIGAPPKSLRAALDEEDALHGDLIEGHWVDSYSNLTLKTLSILEWTVTYCPLAPYLLKVDDDVFLNVARLLEITEYAPVRRRANNTVWGLLMSNARPERDPSMKHYAPPDQYPAAVFPTFVSGAAYLMTADVARHILRAAPNERYFRLEDVLITGIVADRCGVRRVLHPAFHNNGNLTHPCSVKYEVAIHGLRHDERLSLWREVLNNRTKCVAARKRPRIWLLQGFLRKFLVR